MAKLTLDADVSKVKQSLASISQTAKNLGKSPIDLLSAQTVSMLKGEANDQLSKINDKARQLRGEIEKQAQAVNKAKRNTEGYRREMEKLVSLSKQLADNQQSAASFKGSVGGKGGLGGRGFGGFGGAGGLRGLIGGGIAGAGIAALGYGASRVGAGFNRFQAGKASRIRASGLGINPEVVDSHGAASVGLDAEGLRQRKFGAIGAFGAGGAGEGDVVRRAGYERSFGLEGGTLAGLGQGLRGGVGGKGASEDIEKALASAVMTGLEDADIGSYLETAVGFLQSIDSSGIKDRSAMLQALSDVTRNTGDAPEKIARGLGNIDQAIAGSTGEGNAFFQQAFASAGIGGNTIGAAKFATEGGLFGQDLGRVAGLSKAQRGQLGGLAGGGGKTRASAILKQFKSVGIDVNRLKSGKATQQEQITAGRFAQKLLGTKTAAEGLGQLGLLSEVAKGGPSGQAARKKLEDAQKTIEEKSNDNLKKINSTTAAMLDKLEQIRSINEEKIGAVAGQYYEKALGFLNTIDGGLVSLANFLGFKSDAQKKRESEGEEKQKDQHAARIAKGEIAREKLQSGEEISKRELQAINTADRLKKKHSGVFGGLDADVEAKVQQARGDISRKKTKKEAAQIEGSPLQSTKDKAAAEPAAESSNELLGNISNFLEKANNQREQGNQTQKQFIFGQDNSNMTWDN